MKNFHIKSILLGIGIGFVLTSVISMIYLAGKNPYENLSQEYIKAEARKLGMVDNTSLINDSVPTKSTEQDNGKEKKEETQAAAKGKAEVINSNQEKLKLDTVQDNPKTTAASNEQQAKPAVQEIKFKVNPGDTSEKVADRLLGAGLISDKAAFIKELTNMGLATEINIGEFTINKGTDIKGIIKVLTARR